jgi:cystathionine beta-lyase/cystathionine gamma-synthase
MTPRRPGPSTQAIHGAGHRRSPPSPVTTPIYQSSTFHNEVGSTGEVLYTRYGNNPNQVEIGARLAGLEGAEAGIFVGSGMAATALAHLAVLEPGDHLLATQWIYGGTATLFSEEFTRFGIDVTYVDPSVDGGWEAARRDNTRALFVETPTNPLARILDLEPLARLCRAHDMRLLVDSTFASPINAQPLAQGADVAIHSATKYLNGHSDVIAGGVASSAAIVERIRALQKSWGPALDPHAAWLIERGMKTLAVRMARHNENALTLALWASEHPRVNAVHYPGLEQHPDHALALRVLGGFGGIVGIEIAGGAEAAEQVLRRLEIAVHAPSLGGVETLVSEPRLTSHAAMTVEERLAQGIPDGFVRVSVGIEDADDLIADFKHALAND